MCTLTGMCPCLCRHGSLCSNRSAHSRFAYFSKPFYRLLVLVTISALEVLRAMWFTSFKGVLLTTFLVGCLVLAATTIKLSAMTSVTDGMQTSETVNAEWYVNGAWTKDPQDFFDGAKAGETKTRTFTVAARPDRVRVEMNPATDSWGYNKMWVTDGCSVVLYESSTPHVLQGKQSFVEYTIGACP